MYPCGMFFSLISTNMIGEHLRVLCFGVRGSQAASQSRLKMALGFRAMVISIASRLTKVQMMQCQARTCSLLSSFPSNRCYLGRRQQGKSDSNLLSHPRALLPECLSALSAAGCLAAPTVLGQITILSWSPKYALAVRFDAFPRSIGPLPGWAEVRFKRRILWAPGMLLRG